MLIIFIYYLLSLSDRFKIVNCLYHSVDQGQPGSLASIDPATLNVGQNTHRRMLPQSAALEGLVADKQRGRTKRARPGLSPTRHSTFPRGDSEPPNRDVTRASGEKVTSFRESYAKSIRS